jgi:hypothetical protein
MNAVHQIKIDCLQNISTFSITHVVNNHLNDGIDLLAACVSNDVCIASTTPGSLAMLFSISPAPSLKFYEKNIALSFFSIKQSITLI